MAQRLTVVLSQCRHNSSMYREREEAIVTQLLMESNVDLTIVPHVEDIHPDDTSQLCLEGIRGPFVLLSWLATNEAHAELQKRGIAGWPGRTTQEPHWPVQPAGRPIYFLCLAQYPTVDRLLAEIRRIRDDLQTAVVSLVSLGPTPGHRHPTIAPPVVNDGKSAATPVRNDGRDMLESHSSQPSSLAQKHQDMEPRPGEYLPADLAADEDIHLETLLDELDRFLQ